MTTNEDQPKRERRKRDERRETKEEEMWLENMREEEIKRYKKKQIIGDEKRVKENVSKWGRSSKKEKKQDV